MIDPQKVREDFPMYSRGGEYRGRPLHYLDNGATTFKPRCVIDEADRYEREVTANTKRADYILAHDADTVYDESRREV